MRSSAFVVAILAACSQTEDHAAIEAAARGAPDRIAPGVPHGAVITRVALAEHGDAALTIDNLGELRLWPSLDGKRPPVPVAAAAPDQIALGDAGDELVAAILDQAGNVALLRLGRDGSIHGRAQICGDIACDEVIALDDGVLVRRRDQSIERFSATGVSTGRIVPEPGEQIVAITRRRGVAMALINWERSESSLARWIALDGELRWGATVGLPEAVTHLALSPAHDRIAVTYARDNGLRVFDLDPRPRLHSGNGTPIGDGAIGFIDDDHAVIVGSTMAWWEANPDGYDPWANMRVDMKAIQPLVDGAIADGVAGAGFALALALGDPKHLRYLGWKLPAVTSSVTSIVGQIVVPVSATMIWLDDHLVEQREVDLGNLPGNPTIAIAVGPHHVIVRRAVESSNVVELVDLDHPSPVTLGSYTRIDRLEYEPELAMLAIDTGGPIIRFQLDLAHTTAAKLSALQSPGSVVMVRLLAPEHARGASAIVVSSEGEGGERIRSYRASNATKATQIDGAVVAIDGTGTVFMQLNAPATTIVAIRDGAEAFRFQATGNLAVSNDGASMVELRGAEVAFLDGRGVERSRQPLWGGISAMFTDDDRSVVVRTANGLVAFDAATGERRASACGWAFGLHDQPVVTLSAEQLPVCEDVAVVP